jgi:hypothetical protein
MRPKKGEYVKFTDRFLANNNISWASLLKDKELEVMNLKIKTMVPCKIYTIFLMDHSTNRMYPISVNETGHYVDDNTLNVANEIVFEYYHDSENGSMSFSAPMGPSQPTSTSQAPRKRLTVDDTNTTCSLCGAPALDLMFSVECTNPNCDNYKD